MSSPAAQSKRNPYGVALAAITAIAFVVGIILGLIALGVGDGFDPSLSELQTRAALNTWSNFLLVAGVIALVGVLVLKGVEHALRTPAPVAAASPPAVSPPAEPPAQTWWQQDPPAS